MTPKDLEKVLKLAKKHGLKSLKMDGLEVEFGPPAPVQLKMTDDQIKKMAGSVPEMPTADDLLMWSTGGPLPSEIRKAQQEAQDNMAS